MIITTNKYVIIHKECLMFLTEDGDISDNIEDAKIFNNIDYAKGEHDNCDLKNHFEIRELQIDYTIKKEIKNETLMF